MVSFDPLHDVPERLREFAKKRGIPGKGRRLIATKNPDNVGELSASIGTNYRRVGKSIAHSKLMVVLDAEGIIVFTKPRLNQQIEETASTIVRLAESR